MPKLHPIAGLAALLFALSPARADEPTAKVDAQIEAPVRCASVYTFFSVIIGTENPEAKAALTEAAKRFLGHASDLAPQNEQLVSERYVANNSALMSMLTGGDDRKAAIAGLGEELKACGDTEKQIFGSSVRERLGR
ncbi:hypothetical protein [Porphyrobacter sp. AAP82]|uniref:hypothetical protein n=1 Tax=Porphyrobacter sp. AAP82 TaxID=1248917 RepID=UPI0002EDE8B9|nr:hypothetical protein [Porphyrobacter sp. AAP82]